MIGRRLMWRLYAMIRPSSEHVGQAAVEQLIQPFGVDVALVIDPQHVLGKVLGGMAPDLQATGIAVDSGSNGRGS